jgi:oligopeptide/dipeptide ABC transporter ATP-binding protein
VGAVENVSFDLSQGEAIGLVGESGSGKSVSALSLLRLVPMPGRIVQGRVRLEGRDLLSLPDHAMREVRRSKIAMIFQDASNFLNPVIAVGEQIREGIAWREASAQAQNRIVFDALRAVGIADAERVARFYPFQLSGGMQQRAVIAAAVARNPALIIADEPTTALDATVQYQILKLLIELQARLSTGLILISHDLAVIASVCSRVYVMYAAQIIESGPTALLYRAPAHPYTRALLGSLLDPLEPKKTLSVIKGWIPDLAQPPTGCRFHPRCPMVMPICALQEPPTFAVGGGQTAKCWLHAERAEAA